MPTISLIPTDSCHFDKFFEFESDIVAVHMAAFASLATDLSQFKEMWTRRIDNTTATNRTILLGDQVVGGILSYPMEKGRHIGYWIDRNHWGQGIATQALNQFLEIEKTRPVIATCVSDNIGSRKVLEKNGFIYTHSENHPAPARNEIVEEAFFILN
ncbi:MAG: GNAT family N-acetyltransferase [Fimbriimonadaceae bacterium]